MLYEFKIFNENQVIILILIIRVMVNPLFDAIFNRESTIKKWRCFLAINSRAPIALWFGLKMFYSWSLYSSHANLPSQKPILFSNIPNHLFLVFMIGKFSESYKRLIVSIYIIYVPDSYSDESHSYSSPYTRYQDNETHFNSC